MKKQLSHFAYNERSRSGWTLSIPPFTSLSPLRSTIKNCYLCPRHVCYPCLRSAQGGIKGDFSLRDFEPLFFKRGEGEILDGMTRELCGEVLSQDASPAN